jgi:quercetin 2,3-dioxygenase
MLAVRRDTQRRLTRRGEREIWQTFFSEDDEAPGIENFGTMIAFDEIQLPPGDCTEVHDGAEAEMITYVYKGALSQEDNKGNSNVIHAGEFQHTSTGSRIRRKDTSVFQADWTHVFQVCLRPSEAGLAAAQEQKRFTAAQRRKVLCMIASPDGQSGSLRVHQDARVYSTLLAPGHHLIHELLPGRMAWLHIVSGEAALNDIVLTRGDGVGVTDESSVSLTVQEHTELLLVDLGPKTCSNTPRTGSGIL